MATLLEKLKQRQTQAATVTPEMGQTEAAAKLLQAKTGKASTSIAPVSIEQERAVASDVKAAAQPLVQGAALQNIQTTQAQEAISRGEQQQVAQIDQAGREVDSKKAQEIASITQRVQQEADKLGVNKEQAQSEARLFSKRLNTESYIQKIQSEATLNRLDDQVKFDEYVARQTFGNSVSDLLLSQKYSEIMLREDRDWDEKMAQLSIDDFLEMTEFNNKQEANRQKIQAIGSLAQVGASSAAGAMSKGSGSSSTPISNQGQDATVSGSPAGFGTSEIQA
jgi:hypothetical protein